MPKVMSLIPIDIKLFFHVQIYKYETELLCLRSANPDANRVVVNKVFMQIGGNWARYDDHIEQVYTLSN